MNQLTRLMTVIVSEQHSRSEQEESTEHLVKLFSEACNTLFPDNISEQHSKSGLILSPAMAAMCAQGARRTCRYLRALFKAICHIQQQSSLTENKVIRIFYPGCGPYAILALPLMQLFSPETVRLAVLDYHQSSIDSVKKLSQHFALDNHIDDYICADALDFYFSAEKLPDIIISELLLAGLEREGHVGINRHYSLQAPDAFLIPEKINLYLKLCDPEKEFQADHSSKDQHRYCLGQVFSFNKNNFNRVSDTEQASHHRSNQNNMLLPGSRVTLPEKPGPEYQPFLFTELELFADEYLKAYDNGLTVPIVFPFDLNYRPGNKVAFFYLISENPGLRGSYLSV